MPTIIPLNDTETDGERLAALMLNALKPISASGGYKVKHKRDTV